MCSDSAEHHRLTSARAAHGATVISDTNNPQTPTAVTYSLPVVVFSLTAGGDFACQGTEWEELTGQTAQDALDWGWLETIHPDDRLAVTNSLCGVASPLQCRVLRISDGAYRWQQWSARFERGQYWGSLTDVHELKSQAMVLESMHAKLDLATQSAGIGFWTREFGSRTSARSLPQGLGHFDFDAWAESVHPEDRFEVVKRTWESLQERGSFDEEYRVTANGQERWVQSTGRLLESEAGQPLELVGIAVDITDRKRREVTEREDKERLRLALNAARGAAWEWVPSTGETRWSPEFYELVGLDWTVLPSFEAMLDAICPQDKEDVQQAASSVTQEGGLDSEFRIVHPSAGLRWLNLRGHIVSDLPGAPRFFGVCLDVTERHQMEDALRDSARELERRVTARTSDLIAATKEMDEFSYSVAHDLRAPLRAIMSASKILIEDCADRLNPNEVRQLERQAAAAKRMGLLIDDLLEMARFARSHLARYEFDVSRLCKELCDHLVTEHSQAIKRLTIEPGIHAYADPRLARMAFQFLLENCVKFAKPGGAEIEISSSVSDGRTWIRVADKGIGFDQAFVSRLFRPFEKLHPAEQYPGNGIGLANVKRIVERHHGDVTAEGQPDVGASFAITFDDSPTGSA